MLFIEGCSTSNKGEYLLRQVEQAPLSWQNNRKIHSDLINIPKPNGAMIAAVYGFRDQTGQFKAPAISSISTALPQGAASILTTTLQDSGWFAPVEREGLQHLLTERKILRGAYTDEQNERMPKLLGANIIFEGNILGYDTNVKTGGNGAKYFGVGASEKYRVDQLTLTLRAVDIFSGKIITTVTVTKSVYSMELTAGVFRFIKFKRLLEIESGITRNDPVQTVLRDSIETAVLRMIVKGIQNRNWTVKNEVDLEHPIVKYYGQVL